MFDIQRNSFVDALGMENEKYYVPDMKEIKKIFGGYDIYNKHNRGMKAPAITKFLSQKQNLRK